MAETKRRPGRPRVRPENEALSEYVGFRAPMTLKQRLGRAAETNGRSLSTEAQFRLERSFSVEDALSGPARPVLLHVIAAFGDETNPRDADDYRAAMARAITALIHRFPGEFSQEDWNVIGGSVIGRVATSRRARSAS